MCNGGLELKCTSCTDAVSGCSLYPARFAHAPRVSVVTPTRERLPEGVHGRSHTHLCLFTFSEGDRQTSSVTNTLALCFNFTGFHRNSNSNCFVAHHKARRIGVCGCKAIETLVLISLF